MSSPLPPALLEAVLDRMPVARLALVDAAGTAEALPIVFARVGDSLFSPVDGKPKAHGRLARLAHIAARPRVGLTLDHYAHDWSRLWWIKLDGPAQVDHGAHPSWHAAEAALRAKYPQYALTPLFRDEPTLIVLRWERVRWWAADGGGGLAAWLADGAPP